MSLDNRCIAPSWRNRIVFGMGWQEILIIVAIGVLVIGPEQLPQVARTIGKLMVQFRRATSDLRDAVSEEMHQHQELSELKEFSSNLENEFRGVGNTAQEYLEKEIKIEEKELDRLGKELLDTGEEVQKVTQSISMPTEPYGPNLDPPEDPGQPAREEEKEGAHSADSAGDGDHDAPGPDDPRKETA